MTRYGDPAREELARCRKTYWQRLRCCLAGRPVIQVKDLWLEAGIDADRYAGNIDMQVRHSERLLDLGYRPVIVPAVVDAINVLVFVREPWAEDLAAGTVHPRLTPYLADGNPLMALLVGRAQREMRLNETEGEECRHCRTE